MNTTDLGDIAGPAVGRDARSGEFFDAAAENRLAIRRCTHCAHALSPEARTCTACGSTDLSWDTASGAATLVSWAVVHHPPHPDFADQVPFPIGLVELAEGPWINARIVGTAPESLHAGSALHVAFVHPETGESYPVFHVATPGGPL
ncbi:Zn-ribbon domain-containing OB-fold protein [Nocardia carnea]|uniref:Zn-ribbon domain-containing OB-fold protein n=1 Tax=Nocardia carnea TaxID=37328 RepID=UPI0024569089|nr:OB-fold domain-containing protein [Nocardia carnea]